MDRPNRTLRSICLTGLIVCCGLPWQAFAQSTAPLAKSVERRDSDFQISTGVGLSFSGPTMFYTFSRVAPNGFEYDTWKVLENNPSAIEELGISDEQFETMRAMRSQTKQELIAMLTAGGINEDTKQRIERRFDESEFELLEQLSPDQQEQLEQLKTRLEIDSVGLDSFLNSPRTLDRLQISGDQSKACAQAIADSAQQLADAKLELLQDANLKLIAKLDPEDQIQLKDMLGKRGWESFIGLHLITDGAPTKLKSLTAPNFVRSLVYRKSLRQQIKLTEAQFSDIQAVKRARLSPQQANEKLQSILTGPQYQDLVRQYAGQEGKRWGTLRAICGGVIGSELPLSETAAARLFEQGLELDHRTKVRITAAKQEIWQSALASLPPAARETIVNAMTRPAN